MARRTPANRTLAWLLLLMDRAAVAPPPVFTFEAPVEAFLTPITTALAEAGLPDKADMLAAAERKTTTFDPISLTMVSLTPPPAFGSKNALIGSIVAYVHRTPELAESLAQARVILSDEDRLDVLIDNMLVDLTDKIDPLTFPSPFRDLWLLHVYVGEVLNGGVGQFFDNSSGNIALDTALALKKIGLSDQGAVLDKAIALFGQPYAENNAKRAAMNDEVLGVALDKMTDEVDTQRIRTAMAAYARRENVLPR